MSVKFLVIKFDLRGQRSFEQKVTHLVLEFKRKKIMYIYVKRFWSYESLQFLFWPQGSYLISEVMGHLDIKLRTWSKKVIKKGLMSRLKETKNVFVLKYQSLIDSYVYNIAFTFNLLLQSYLMDVFRKFLSPKTGRMNIEVCVCCFHNVYRWNDKYVNWYENGIVMFGSFSKLAR